MYNELERLEEQELRHFSGFHIGIHLEGLGITMKNLSWNGHFPGQDSYFCIQIIFIRTEILPLEGKLKIFLFKNLKIGQFNVTVNELPQFN
jgi:hypothetical protein